MEYKDKIEEINQSGEFRAFITVEEDIRKKMNTERELGREEKSKEMILKMNSSDIPIKKIAEIVGIRQEEVKEIIEESFASD